MNYFNEEKNVIILKIVKIQYHKISMVQLHVIHVSFKPISSKKAINRILIEQLLSRSEPLP